MSPASRQAGDIGSGSRQAGGDRLVLLLVATLAGLAAAVWLAAGVGGVIAHGSWPPIAFSDAATAVPRLVSDPAHPTAAWPRAAHTEMPAPRLFYALLALPLVLAAGALVMRQVLNHRPGRAGRRGAGVLLGRPVPRGRPLYGALDDSYCVLGPPRSGTGGHFVVPTVLGAPGAAVVLAAKPDTLRATAAARGRRGPVHVFDPQDISGWRPRLRWAPQDGCEAPATALSRARALTAGVRTGGGGVEADLVQTVVRCYLHALALAGGEVRELLRWMSDPLDPAPLHALQGSAGAADGWAGELREQIEADPRQRTRVWTGVRQAFAWLADPPVLEACTPDPGERFDIAQLLRGRGTLYLVGTGTGGAPVTPLVTALIEDVVEHGRRAAARSPGGRLDPPLLAMLEDVATAAPLPWLPRLLADAGGFGVTIAAVLPSLSQARERWGEAGTAAVWEASTVKLVFGGVTPGTGPGGVPLPGPGAEAERLRGLPYGRAVILQRGAAVTVDLPRA
ncbi:MAG: type IV secretory system conjugative DNA transfer family protein [Streptomycetales bacterium]